MAPSRIRRGLWLKTATEQPVRGCRAVVASKENATRHSPCSTERAICVLTICGREITWRSTICGFREWSPARDITITWRMNMCPSQGDGLSNQAKHSKIPRKIVINTKTDNMLDSAIQDVSMCLSLAAEEF